MTYEMFHGVKRYGSVYSHRELGDWHKIDRWRAMRLPRGQVSRGQSSDKIRQKLESAKASVMGESKREQKKAKVESDDPAKKLDMDQNEGKSKVHSLQKHKRLQDYRVEYLFCIFRQLNCKRCLIWPIPKIMMKSWNCHVFRTLGHTGL